MRWTLLGILIGVVIGLLIQLSIPDYLTRYTAVSIMGILDAIFGGFRSEAEGEFSAFLFGSGLLFNIMLAAGITYLGDRLGLDLYLAATVVFTFRIFTNLGVLRRILLDDWIQHKQKN